MPRLVGVDIPGNKKLAIALTYIYGLGHKRARQVCDRAGMDADRRASELTENDLATLAQAIQDEHIVEGDLRRQNNQDVRRLVSIGSYRGIRHKRGLPVRGQRTKTNARTRKGAKKTVGAIRDRAERRQTRSEEGA